MSLPEPPSSVDRGCSVVHDNTLYVFTPTAFLSLSLEQDAEWKELKMGEQVTGSVCVGTGAGIFVIGGTGGTSDYNGLQTYSFADNKWTSVTIPNSPFQDLQYHGATYIKNSDQIVVYAGTQDGRQSPSSKTQIFAASNPGQVESKPPSSLAVSPILLPWSDDDACMVGGSDGNAELAWFNSATGWRRGVTLAEPLLPSSKALVMQGDDGSKSLFVFDLLSTPNKVHRYVVWGDSNAPATPEQAVDQNAKRDLSLNDWPEYNSTLAPTTPRSAGDYSVAQDANGRVVFVGGNADEPVAFFDMKKNSWLDASQIIGPDSQKVLSAESSESETKTSSTKTSSTESFTESSTDTATESSSATESVTSEYSSTFTTETATESDSLFASETIPDSSSATNTDAAAIGGGSSDGDSGLSTNAILGITLGTILGFLALLIVILLLLRRRKKNQQTSPEAPQPRHDFPPDEKDPMGLGGAPISPHSGHFRGHNSHMSTESYSSMAILMGRAGKNKGSISRKASNGTNRSFGSTKELKSTIGKPILQEMQHPVLQGQDTRGVAFDPTVAEPRPRNGPLETQDGLRRSSGWNRYWSGGSALQILGFGGSKRNTVGSDSESHYSDSPAYRNPRVTQDSATVPPLNFDFRPEMSRVNSGSPVVAEYNRNIPFRDGVAGKIERPTSKASSGYSSGIPESINETWDPDYKEKPWGTDRATSSIYNPSFYFGTPLSPHVPPPQTPPSGVSTQPQLAMASQSSDMSWLNLGDRARK
ncbi:hypothetical protein F66182_6717 [Fusarium sp. NRRL 66182]|nr:hypothetical protein F66182_6717 [Fusarium sp. NRRL 66182]